MKKMFKIIAMLLVITTVIFAAGCASKTAPATDNGASEEVTDQNVVANEDITENGTTADVAPGDDLNVTPAEDDTNVTPAEDDLNVTPVEDDLNVTPVEDDTNVTPAEGDITETPTEEQ